MPTHNKTFTPEAKRDLIIALITLKYTQSNSVCYVKDGQAIGIGAGQQSRIHCTRLAGSKADTWWLRQCPKVMNLPFKEGIRRADRDNTIDVYISDDHDDVLRDGVWQQFFTEKPAILTREEKRDWIAQNTNVALGSDAFFPFGDNIERAHKSGVQYIAQAGGSIRDDNVIETCDKYDIAMAIKSPFMSDIDEIIETGLVFRAAPKAQSDNNKVKTKAKKKKYITGAHGSGSAKQKAKYREQRAKRHR